MIRTMQMNLPMAMVPVNGAIVHVSQVSTGKLLGYIVDGYIPVIIGSKALMREKLNSL